MKRRILRVVFAVVVLGLPASLFGQAAAEYGAHLGGVAAPAARAASGLGRANNALAGRAEARMARARTSAPQVYDHRVVIGRRAAAAANSMPARQAGGFTVQRTAADCSAVDLKTTKDKAAASAVEPDCVKASAAAPAAGKPDATVYPAAVTLSFKKK